MKSTCKTVLLSMAAALLTAGMAAACEGHAKADLTANKVKAGCGKATTTTATVAGTTTSAGATGGCAKSAGATATKVAGKSSCCAKGAGATTTTVGTTSHAGAGCAKAEGVANAGKGCSKTQMTAGGKGCCASKGASATSITTLTGEACSCVKAGKVAMRGTVLCNHCDLHAVDTCQTVFKTADGCLFRVKDGDRTETLREQALHGSKLVRVRGTMSPNGEITLASFRVIGDAPSTFSGI